MREILYNYTMVKRILALTTAASLLVGCSSHQNTVQGYVEAQLTYMSSPYAGELMKLGVQRGAFVKAHKFLFQLAEQPQLSALKSAIASVDAAMANLDNLKRGKRPSEIAAIQASMRQAHAALVYSQQQLQRMQRLVRDNFVQKQSLDQALSTMQQNKASLANLRAQLLTAKLPARSNLIKQASAQLEQAKANLQQASWNLSQKTVRAPVNAQVFDTYYRVGEQVPANTPVLSLLAPKDKQLQFYVPEPLLSKIKVGSMVGFSCDGCAKGLQAKVTYVSPESEYTPPVIYSRANRSKLVYRVEGKLLGSAAKLNAGEPVDVDIRG